MAIKVKKPLCNKVEKVAKSSKTKKKTTKVDKYKKLQEQYFYKEIKDVSLAYIAIYKKLNELSLEEKAKQMIDSIIIDLNIIKKRYSKR